MRLLPTRFRACNEAKNELCLVGDTHREAINVRYVLGIHDLVLVTLWLRRFEYRDKQ